MAIIQKKAKVKGVADIVFCLDATGSMQPCIDKIKENIGNFAQTIKTNSPNVRVDWRARLIAYRDFNEDEEFLVNNLPFVETPEELQKQLDTITASGGGDEPESTLDAILYAIKKSDFRENSHKVIVVFTDASPHLHLNEKTLKELDIPDEFEVFRQILLEERIKLFLFAQKHSLYEEIAKFDRANVILYENAVNELPTSDFKSILDTIGKTVSSLASSGDVL